LNLLGVVVVVVAVEEVVLVVVTLVTVDKVVLTVETFVTIVVDVSSINIIMKNSL
jgi:hypothetical protein